MKLKLLFSVVFACTLLTTSFAQINKGSAWLGSNFSYSQTKDWPGTGLTSLEARTIAIRPAFGVAIKENLVLGIFGNYDDTHIERDKFFDQQEKRYGGGLFVRRYVPIINRFYIFGEGRLAYNSSETTASDLGTGVNYSHKIKGWETGLTFTPGISYGVTQNLQLEAGFSSLFNAWYSNAKMTSNLNPDTKTKSFSVGANIENLSAFTIGFRFLINKKA